MTSRTRLLVVGVGSIGERHLRCFLESGRADVSFVEINDALRSTIADRYGVEGFPSLDTAMAESPVAAVVATPAHLHIPIAMQLANAGVHLLIEKPLSTSEEGVLELQRIVEEKRLTASVAYVYRAFPALAAMRKAVAEGRFGRPVEIVAVCGQHFPTYRPAYREIYYANRASGGGAIQDALTHVLNAGEWIVGPIDRLVADADHQVLEGVDVEDTVHVLTRQGNVLGSYSLNQHQAPNEAVLTVVCERGTARWQSHTQDWRWVTKPDEPWHVEAFDPLPRDAAFITQANHFLDAIEGDGPPACSIAEGLQTLRVNLAALASVDDPSWKRVSKESCS